MATANSLRKKTRGVESLPRRQSVYHGMSGTSGENMPPPPRVQAKDKSKVESLMKRRYSTRAPPPSIALEPFPAVLSVKGKPAGSGLNEKVDSILK
jgi:hypothetical protein